jgi:tRNA A37 threonylcarbamoyladenosine synthetase subunit TsaC/SUA5/YrdC
MSVIDARPRSTITDADQVARIAEALAAGAVVAHGFGNFYAITTRSDADTVSAVNVIKGRPAGQVGSITGPTAGLTQAWDLDRLPDGLPARTALTIVDTLFSLGPFGFRAPAAATVPRHLSELDGEIPTAQVIAPGYRCPSNTLLAAALRATGDQFLYITSANRSRHRTGAADSPAHWRADGLRAEFGDHPEFLIVEHPDEAAARAAYPLHLPMSTTVLGLRRVTRVPGDPRPHLVLERHGSLPVEQVRQVLAEFGYGLVLGPRAATRLLLRDYSERLGDR